MSIAKAVPLLRVSDVARSMEWYRSNLGFLGDPFPAAAPHEFAILRNGTAEIMLRRTKEKSVRPPKRYDWDLYLRLENTPFRELFATLSARGIVHRRLERMFYGLAEFEISDPDGYIVCLSQQLADASDLPSPEA